MTSLAKALMRDWRPITGEITTLNVEDGNLRLLSVVGKKVRRWGSLPLELGLSREGLILDRDRVGAGISALFTFQKASKRKVVTSLSGLGALHRTLNLPRMDRRLLKNVVMREARRVLPSSPEQLYLSWQIIGQNTTGFQVYLLGVPRNLLEGHIKALQAARVRATAMDLKPLALARAINRSEAIIANLESECLDIIIVVNYIPVIMRAIPLGEESPKPADKFHRLMEEMEQTIGFYDDSHQDSQLPPNTPAYLTGGLVNLPIPPNIKEGIETRIKYPLAIPEPPLEYPPELPLSRYMVNLGLALKKV